jgi:hypothetical protein
VEDWDVLLESMEQQTDIPIEIIAAISASIVLSDSQTSSDSKQNKLNQFRSSWVQKAREEMSHL